jgi:prepilin peptidase CpaA
MTATASSALWFLPFVAPIAIWAAYSDLSTMKIPNKSVLALMAIFITVGLIALPFPEYWPRLIHFVVILLVGFVVTMIGLVGAGDAKFAAAMAPFVALGDAVFVVMLFAVCAVICVVGHRLAKKTPLRNLSPNWESWKRTKEFPMGLPLAACLVIYLFFVAFN